MQYNHHRKIIVGKGLIATLLFTWLSIYCQHCLAFAEQTQPEISHAHCVDQAQQQTPKYIDTESLCISDCSNYPAIQDTHKLQKNELKTCDQYTLVAINDFTYRQKNTITSFREFPPDQSLFLPVKRYTIQLK